MYTPQTFAAVQVLVVGDVMLDRYWFGSVERISPEAPVPVINVVRTEERAGGAANVAANIAALGAQCTLLSVTGDDAAGNTLAKILDQPGIDAVLHVDDQAQTTVKLRVLSKNQQLLRADFEAPPAHEVLGSCLDEFRRRVSGADIVLISDYGKGGLYHIREMITAANAADTPVIVDPKGDDFARYANASLITPNLNELENVVGPGSDEAELNKKTVKLINELHIGALLLTRSEHGMSLYFRDGRSMHCDAAARDVYDVSGAGDTVISACAVATAAGMAHEEMLRFANTAAGIVVAKLGTAAAGIDEVAAQLEHDL
ncbi:D-glycero-beta-D-manno-heptose-7-phosphate kinase [Gammaproteobacteria bacterium]|nr:D-glycero-beta-D-manno-heptose-7-phosphate kinase [Gammaproteobacteria bacterium]